VKKLLLNITFLLLIIPFGYSFFNEITMFNIDVSRNYMFLLGTIAFFILYSLLSNKLQYFSTFEHELTHNIWALLFFKKPRGFHVNTDGSGLFEWSGSSGLLSKVFILLSPYFFPTITMFLILLSLIIKDGFISIFFLVIGISFGYHIVSTIKEIHLEQTDITENGYFTSFNTIVLMSLIMNGVVIAFINNGYNGIAEFFISAYMYGYNLVISIL
tara:strand:- start:497 stop:1141 length:645 start_codon:yes stop_codon:yes gene_type:complete